MSIAWISGRSGRAVIDTGQEIYLLVDGEEGPPTRCSRRQLEVLRRSSADVQKVEAGGFPFDSARTALAKAVAADRAWLFALGVLDKELEEELRSDLAADLESLIKDDSVLERLLGLLRSGPLAAAAELGRGIELAAARGASTVVNMLERLGADAESIERAHATWSQFAAAFRSDSEAAAAHSWVAREGGFRWLVESIRQGSPQPFAEWTRGVAKSAPRSFGPTPAAALERLLSLTSFLEPSKPDPGADDALSWLDFLEECRNVLSLAEGPEREQRVALPRALFETASRLRTRTASVLARVMITRLAEHVATVVSKGPGVAETSTTDSIESIASSLPSQKQVDDPRVRTVLEYVESRHTYSACRLDDVARNLRVSRSYLSRLVFKETGVTFNRHLQLARMNTAARLLQESNLSIKEISHGTGYEHIPSFVRHFRSHFNLGPSAFRRAVATWETQAKGNHDTHEGGLTH